MKIISGVKLKTKSPTPIGRVRQDCVKEVWGPEEKLHNPSAAVLIRPLLRCQRGRARGGRLAWYRPDLPTEAAGAVQCSGLDLDFAAPSDRFLLRRRP